MSRVNDAFVNGWKRVGLRFLPFADAASEELPLPRLLRLSLFQITVGMAMVLLNGTLNRVMIVELDVKAWLVALMVSLPLLFAPLRALIGFRSDNHRSLLGWRRVPYIWMGTLLQFGGLAIMPFALLLLSGDTQGPAWVGDAGAALAFLLVGAGLHTTQTAGLALATDLAPASVRPRVVALLYVMLLVGMVFSAVVFSELLREFSQLRLIQVIQGSAVATMLLNLIALWKQEARDPGRTRTDQPRARFRESWQALMARDRSRRFLVAVGLGTAGFSMQDILLEPYGGQVLHLAVGATTSLTALMAGGALTAFMLAARLLGRGADPYRLGAYGATAGVFAFAAIQFAAPMHSNALFGIGTALIGFGGGLFAIGTLTAAMQMQRAGESGLILGAWGAVQATAAGIAIALGGAIRDAVSAMAVDGALGEGLQDVSVGYGAVYQIEIVLLFITLVAMGPLVRTRVNGRQDATARFGLAELPG
jgi:BCD family chlorophyll transporter-like MFS transporter